MNKITILNLCLLLVIFNFSCSNDSNQDNSIFSGEIEWAKTYGGSGEDFAKSVIQTIDGNLLIFGNTKSIDGDIIDKTIAENDYWLIKLNLNGDIIWSKTYGGSGDDVGEKVIQTNDGGFVIVGYSRSNDGDASNNEGFHDNWILKLDNSGNILWEKSFGFAGHDHAYSIIQTKDGGFFMTGFLDVTASGGEGNNRSYSTLHGVGEFWCHKLDRNGNIEWRRYFGGSSNDRSYDAVQANDGGFVITGLSESNDFDISNSIGSYDYWVIKIDGLGNLLWERSLGGLEIDQSRAIVKTDDNSYIVAGNSFSIDGDNSSNFGSSDFLLVKLNDDGETVWSKNYGGTNFDYATSINQSKDGYIVSGYSKSNDINLTSNYGDNDFWVLKINNQGVLLWQKSFGGSSLDFAFDAIETLEGKIIVVGETESNDFDISENKGLKDVLVLKIK
jgi:hypothetical protein